MLTRILDINPQLKIVPLKQCPAVPGNYFKIHPVFVDCIKKVQQPQWVQSIDHTPATLPQFLMGFLEN